ncbi:type II toxin-antitoxin system PemK/MazF family toxin [Metabacillus sp. FJAT-52054]|uniref:Type II toxin-antitoxin system PemK/MazF family toxin n=1 Tax=Metabacillus sediminis TaxID=3117746 RepID=A0ABZ2NG58_9BACI
MQIGDIYYISFPFDPPAQGGKFRPALILGFRDNKALAVAVKITKSSPNQNFPHRVPITYWQNAGLKYMSYAQINNPTSLSMTSKPVYVGTMHPVDLNKVLTAFSKFHSK